MTHPHSVSAAPVWSGEIWIKLLTKLSIQQSHAVWGKDQQEEQETPTEVHERIFGQAVWLCYK